MCSVRCWRSTIHWKRLARVAALVALLLTACSQANPSPTPAAPPASPTASEPPPSATPTPAPTEMPAPTRTLAPTASLPPTQTPAPAVTALPSETPTPEATPTPTEPLTDRAAFVADITAPDGSPYQVNTAFVKTWRVKNVGTATWTTGYALVFVKGDAMTTTTEIPLAAAVGPGETADLTLTLTAPAKTGRARGFWLLRNAAGVLFGIGPEANEPVYVDIFAVTDTVASGPPVQVNGVTLRTANAVVSAPCPYDLILNGALDLNANGTGRVTGQLEATFSDPNFKFTAPDPADFNFTGIEPNPFPFVYTLTFVGNAEAQFRMHILTPTELRSEPVTFSLTCTAASLPTAGPTPAP